MTVRVFAKGAVRGVTFANNTFTAQTGLGGDWATAAVRVSVSPSNTQMADAGLTFRGNTFQAVVTAVDPSLAAPSQSSTAWALTIPNLPAGTGLVFQGNTFASNDVSVNLGDDTGYGSAVSDALFLGNTIAELSQGAAMAYHGVVAGAWQNSVTGIRLIDSTYAGGATGQIVLLGTMAKDVEVGSLVGVAVNWAGGEVVAGAIVTITDSQGRAVYTGATDASGQVSDVPVVTQVIAQAAGTDPSQSTTTNMGAFTLGVTSGTSSQTQTFTIDGDTKLSVTLP
jgi:hypothetical protein